MGRRGESFAAAFLLPSKGSRRLQVLPVLSGSGYRAHQDHKDNGCVFFPIGA